MRRLWLLLVVLAALAAVSASVASANHDGSLVVRYPFDTYNSGPHTTPDASGHNLALELFGSEAFLFPGRFGNAAAFGPTTGYQTADNALLEPPDSAGLSVHAWVSFHPDNEGGAQTPGPNKALVAKGGRGCRAPSYELSTGADEGLEFAVDVDRSDVPGHTVVRTPAVPPDEIWDGQFHAVTGVYGAASEDGVRSVQLWVDGVLVGARELPENVYRIDYFDNHVIDGQLTVGRIIQDSCTDDRGFSGDIDDLRIYSEALTRRQIRYLAEDDLTQPPDLRVSPPPGFADWTAVETGKVSGTLLGSSISLTGANVDPNSQFNLDGLDSRFNHPEFTPSLSRSDAPDFFGSTGSTYTLSFGAPVKDPVIHLSSLSSTLQFEAGTSVSRVSGDDDFAASGSTVSGVGDGGYGP
ncbi:MAG: hypothetical protein QOH46_3312, partial [Solirubrobacteraceae bacterium]|nr:hypothetical protein [Solirubrobacteraceae bacterium]